MKRHFKAAVLLLSLIMILASCSEPSLESDRVPVPDPQTGENVGRPDTEGDVTIPPDEEKPHMKPILAEIGCKANPDGTVEMPGGVVLTEDGLIAGTVDGDGNLKNPDGRVIERTRGTDDDYILIDTIQGNTAWEIDKELYSNGTKTDDRNGRITFTLDRPYVKGDMTVHYMYEVDYHHMEPESTDKDVFVVFSIDADSRKQSFHMKERREGNIVMLDGRVIEYPVSP